MWQSSSGYSHHRILSTATGSSQHHQPTPRDCCGKRSAFGGVYKPQLKARGVYGKVDWDNCFDQSKKITANHLVVGLEFLSSRVCSVQPPSPRPPHSVSGTSLALKVACVANRVLGSRSTATAAATTGRVPGLVSRCFRLLSRSDRVQCTVRVEQP